MSNRFIDDTAPSLQRGYPRSPENLPHGLICPPEAVRELLATEKAKHPPQVFNAVAEERILNQWTLDYYFNRLGHEVIYRQKPEGPEVLAVGEEEVIRLKKALRLEEQLQLKTWMP
jgi:hypothetical protein